MQQKLKKQREKYFRNLEEKVTIKSLVTVSKFNQNEKLFFITSFFAVSLSKPSKKLEFIIMPFSNIASLDISKIYPNKHQPRKSFEDKDIQQLSNSIKNQGLIQPIVVRETTGNMYEIIAGERRWLASQSAGLNEVPVVILEVDDVKYARKSSKLL